MTTIERSHYEHLKSRTDAKSKYLIDSLHRTLDHFQVIKERDTIAEVLLKFAIFQKENQIIPTDGDGRKLMEMLKFLKKEIGV